MCVSINIWQFTVHNDPISNIILNNSKSVSVMDTVILINSEKLQSVTIIGGSR